MQPRDLTYIRYRRFIFPVTDHFLTEQTHTGAPVNYFIQVPYNISGQLHPFYTPLIDLRQSLEKIREGIYHRTLSEINSFIANQKFEHRILTEFSRNTLSQFIRLFNDFAREKKIRKAERARLQAYRRYGILAISFIRQNGAYVCVNFYRLTAQRACNISSFTITGAAANASQAGRAHRALHWLDILACKEAGVQHYDLCGWYAGKEDQHLLNINAFKEQFTRTIVKEYSGVIYRNSLLLILSKLLQ